MTKVVWTLAGFDPSSGAGITADLMTFAAHGLFGCSAITAYTVQSTRGVAAVEPVSPALLERTLEHLLADLAPAGVKIGMLGSAEVAGVTGTFLQRLRGVPEGAGVPIVLDPVLRSSSGRELFPPSGLRLMHERVLPYVDWITPNWSELGVLAGSSVSSEHEVEVAARAVRAQHPHLNLAVTGGDQPRPVELVFTREGERIVVSGEHVETTSTHGTGCAFSSALLCALVQGARPEEAVRSAKAYVAGALRQAPGVGGGQGPMGLLWPLTSKSRTDRLA